MNLSSGYREGLESLEPVSDEIVFEFDYTILLLFMFLLSTLGVVGNLVNCVTFARQGLQDRIHLTLFSLSTTDLLSSLACFGFTTVVLCNVLGLETEVTYNLLMLTLLIVRCMFADLCSIITVFISIERCLCVTMPFLFNTTSSARKTQILLLSFAAFILLNYIPLLATERAVPVFDPGTNSTVLDLEVSEEFEILNKYNDYVFGFALSFSCQICVFVCAVLMYDGLRKSSQIRDSSREFGDLSAGDTKPQGQLMSRKERRVVKMVLMLACLYVPTGIPQMIFVLVRFVLPELYSGRYRSILESMSSTLIAVSNVNGALSFFIYFKFSSNFRKTFLRITPKSLL
ncbi:uncharacterized protein LOC131946357 [Physella acuta]|uniref:uncharacterized protein LOC131946357 n=1 Tax=Physella acuta TaxID=109671 RepID=UPI0027DD7125|nr:uncharacterized protein LOC131946357 [Physella acuta]